ncbi:MAG: GNAT family N-acetyltransferase [Planctomycetota bacterium]|jgi:ribosomal protein S18 acetylase RimI-like enzyme
MFEVRSISNQEIDKALELLSCGSFSGSEELAAKVVSFREQAQRERYDLARQLAVLDDNHIIYTCFVEASPSRTVFILSDLPKIDNPQKYDHQAQVIGSLAQWAFDQGSNFVQIILEPDDHPRQKICSQMGFRQLTDLIYLHRAGSVQQANYAPPDNVSWLLYNKKNHTLFKRLIQQSLEYSLDSPELKNLRGTEDIINSLKAADRFDPAYWKALLCKDSPKAEPVGVLVSAPTPQRDAIEIIYLGVVPQMRGKGLGKVLLNEVINCAEQIGVESLLVSVDCRNHPALKLYEKFDFKVLFHRTVLYYCTKWNQAKPAYSIFNKKPTHK